MGINSKVDICNMALTHLGNKNSVNNIDTPTTEIEKIFAAWYEITIQVALKQMMPNFAVSRGNLAQVVYTAPFGFTNAYLYPADALKILGIGDIQDTEVDYTIEGGRILTDIEYTDGLPVRYIKDVQDVSSWSPEFKIGASWLLANNVALEITQDEGKSAAIEGRLPIIMASIGALNSQENKPIRISNSNFKAARLSPNPRTGYKK